MTELTETEEKKDGALHCETIEINNDIMDENRVQVHDDDCTFSGIWGG